MICGVGGVGFCILLEGAPHFALTGETATAMLAVLLLFIVIFSMSLTNPYVINACKPVGAKKLIDLAAPC